MVSVKESTHVYKEANNIDCTLAGTQHSYIASECVHLDAAMNRIGHILNSICDRILENRPRCHI